jgi:hypothetical protein
MSQGTMSPGTISQDETPAEESFTEAEIADYLRRRPDFFERNLPLLLRLKLPLLI